MRLNTREKTFILFGAVVLAAILVYLGLVEPLAARRDQLRAQAIQYEKDIVEMRRLAGLYRAAAEAREQLAQQVRDRGVDFKPISYLETLARESGLTDQVESMTPVASGTEDNSDLVQFDLRLSKLSLEQLVQFLHRVETSEKVFFVQSLAVKPRYLTPKILDVSLRLASPRPS